MAWKRTFARYLTINDRARDWQIFCTDCGCAETPAGGRYPPFPQNHPPEYADKVTSGRILSEFQLVYITNGAGIFRTEYSSQLRVREGNMLLLFPGVWHAYRPDPATGWDEYWVGFAGGFPEHLVEKGFISPEYPVLDIGYSEALLGEYIRIFEISMAEAPGFQIELGGAIANMLATLVVASERARHDSESREVAERAKFYMEEHLFHGLDLDDLTRVLGMSYSKFRSHFKNYTGLTPYQYFLQLKVNHAKRMLREGKYSVQQVAYELNFENQFYFSRLFKKKTGVCPSDWQRQEFHNVAKP